VSARTVRALPLTFLQLCVVAAHTHFPASYQRAKVIKFSNEGNAAITQNCPLVAGGFHAGYLLLGSVVLPANATSPTEGLARFLP